MPTTPLAPTQLRLTIAPDSLGFASTAELQDLPLPWIGQERAEAAARVPPDLCYLHNFDAPERPRALRLPAGQGRVLRQGMEKLTRTLQTDIPKRLDGADFRAESERIEKAYESQESQAFAALDAFAEALQFRLSQMRAPSHANAAPRSTPPSKNCVPRSPASSTPHAPWNANATRPWSNCAARSPNRCSTMNCKKCATACASRSRTPSSWASGWTRYTSRCWTT